ncbi:tRNA pseudouridine synthase D [Cenarchaeum symbiosum A]|uniref:tRNA pseudouridine synthase D n=1 Tax=Cenarchaeum symbiosum (strain A) TaxID=414004 RepID=A0RUY1_CENSY|nr:tRNA pseudouridine synthase D [Cenarchaeum symbiosum A]
MEKPAAAAPAIDAKVGISGYSTIFPGTGGRIRERHEDFEVSEVLTDAALNKIGSGGYAVYILKKRGMDTSHALRRAAKAGLRLKALGLKDAAAVTEQYVCSMRKGPAKAWSSGTISLSHAGYVERPLSGKDMAGNRFSIRITGTHGDASEFDGYNSIPNHYGYQRFGSARPVSHLIGRAIVKGDFDWAVDLLLSHPSEYDSTEKAELRRSLGDREKLAGKMGDIPPGMDLERTAAAELVRHGDARRALAALPSSMAGFFVQAYQSYIFNKTLSGTDELQPAEGDVCYTKGLLGRYSDGTGQYLAIPTVGYAYFRKTRFDGPVSGILKEEGVRPADFGVKELPKAAAEGGFRQAVIGCSDARSGPDRAEFTLSRGSYATMVMREIIKPSDPIASGF